MIKKYYLLSPGPTPVPERALSAAAEPIIHHRTPEFSTIFMEVTEGLKYVFGTKEDAYILTSSGTGAMETAVVNLLSPGDKVLTINAGKFGERWGNICKAYGIAYKEIVLDVGQGLHQGGAGSRAQGHARLQGRLRQLSETSSGAMFDIQGFGEVVAKTPRRPRRRRHLRRRASRPAPWTTGRSTSSCPGSQKSFMIPPGLAFIALSPKAWTLAETPSCPSSTSTSRRPRRTWPTRRRPGRPASPWSSSRRTPWTSSRRWASKALRPPPHPGRRDPGRRQGPRARAPAEAAGQRPDLRQGPGRDRRRQARQDHAGQVHGLHRRRPGPQQGQVLPHRPPRLHGRIRHHHRPRRPWR